MTKRVPVSVSVMKKRVSGGKYCRILLLTFVWPPPATNKALSPPSLCLGPFQFTASKQVLLRLLPRFDLFPPSLKIVHSRTCVPRTPSNS